MVDKKKLVFVVLTEEARQRYGRDLLLPRLLATPHHFACESAVQDGAFLLLKVQLERQPKEPFRFELAIPLADVLYYVSTEDRKQAGFIEDQFANDPGTT